MTSKVPFCQILAVAFSGCGALTINGPLSAGLLIISPEPSVAIAWIVSPSEIAVRFIKMALPSSFADMPLISGSPVKSSHRPS